MIQSFGANFETGQWELKRLTRWGGVGMTNLFGVVLCGEGGRILFKGSIEVMESRISVCVEYTMVRREYVVSDCSECGRLGSELGDEELH